MNKEIGIRLNSIAKNINDIENNLKSLNRLLDKKHGHPPNRIELKLFDVKLELGFYDMSLYNDTLIALVDSVLLHQKTELEKRLLYYKEEIKELLEEK